jgi:hypothetical protein
MNDATLGLAFRTRVGSGRHVRKEQRFEVVSGRFECKTPQPYRLVSVHPQTIRRRPIPLESWPVPIAFCKR